jgi:hypothetical protein
MNDVDDEDIRIRLSALHERMVRVEELLRTRSEEASSGAHLVGTERSRLADNIRLNHIRLLHLEELYAAQQRAIGRLTDFVSATDGRLAAAIERLEARVPPPPEET